MQIASKLRGLAPWLFLAVCLGLQHAHAQQVGNNISGVVSLTTTTPQALQGPISAPNLMLNVRSYGAKGDGSTDDTAAINNALTACTTGLGLRFPAGTYNVSSGFQTNTCSIYLDAGATVKATAAMTAVFSFGTASVFPVNLALWGFGTIDANSQANYAVYIRGGFGFQFRDITIRNALVHAVHMGDPALTGYNAYGLVMTGTQIYSTNTVTNSAGLYISNYASDNFISNNTIIGYQYGVIVYTGGNDFTMNHIWGGTSSGYGNVDVCYDDHGYGNFWSFNDADSCNLKGWNISGDRVIMLGNRMYATNPAGTMVGLVFNETNPQAKVIGNDFEGASSSRELAYDMTYTGSGSNITFLGNTRINIVNPSSPMSVGESGTSLQMQSSLLWGTDNTYDIGASAASRPRNGYFGNSLNASSVNASYISANSGSIQTNVLRENVQSITTPYSQSSSGAGVMICNGGSVTMPSAPYSGSLEYIINVGTAACTVSGNTYGIGNVTSSIPTSISVAAGAEATIVFDNISSPNAWRVIHNGN